MFDGLRLQTGTDTSRAGYRIQGGGGGSGAAQGARGGTRSLIFEPSEACCDAWHKQVPELQSVIRDGGSDIRITVAVEVIHDPRCSRPWASQ